MKYCVSKDKTVELHFEILRPPFHKKNIIIFLHGFGGSLNDFKDCALHIDKNFTPVGIDLIGHGQSPSPENFIYYNENSIILQIKSVLDKLDVKEINLAGYSMGGRAALSFALTFPAIIKSLILESSSAGIENNCERSERMKSDEILSSTLKNEGTEFFFNRWINMPLFGSLRERFSEDLIEKYLEKKKGNNAIGLSNILTEFSPGKVKSKWKELDKINFPVLLITGEKDKKYCKINEKMRTLINGSDHQTIKTAGHVAHLEEPQIFINLVNAFLRKLNN